MPRRKKTPEEVSAARSAVAKLRWAGVSREEHSRLSKAAASVRWGNVPVETPAVAEPVAAVVRPEDVIRQGQWYTKTAMVHWDADKACGRDWQTMSGCGCGGCRVARREAK